MKKIALFLIVLLAGCSACLASVVPQDRAARVASSFLARRTASLSSSSTTAPSVELVATFPSVQTKAASDPARYVFEGSRGGYVVVAGDDVSMPVIGYSTTGHFPSASNMPVNLKSLLDWHASVIEYARSQGWTSTAQVQAEWNGRMVRASGKKVLETAKWGQEEPFNELCPKRGGEKCPTGCVATAMAIIMRYHQYPAQGKGTLPGYDFGWSEAMGKYTGHIDGYALGHTYDWEQMPLEYLKGRYTEEQAHQVAQLMYDLGVMSQMEYSSYGSGAASDAPVLLSIYFGYDRGMRFYDRMYYSGEAWAQLLRNEINAGRPVFHTGYDKEGGHAFVIDGYDGDYFSINLGWGEGSDFYRLSVSIDGKDDRLTDFTDWQDMIGNIRPDQGGEGKANLMVLPYYQPQSWDFRSKSFTMEEQGLWAVMSVISEWPQLCYARYDRNGQFREQVSDAFSLDEETSSTPATVCHLTEVADGDRVMLSMRSGGSWEPLQQSRFSYLVFDRSRKLSDMVKLGYCRGNADEPEPKGNPYFFLDGYKDIYWEIWSEDLGMRLATSADYIAVVEVGDQQYIYVPEYRDDEYDGSRTLFWFAYPSGTYRILLRNFDEELTLTVDF